MEWFGHILHRSVKIRKFSNRLSVVFPSKTWSLDKTWKFNRISIIKSITVVTDGIAESIWGSSQSWLLVGPEKTIKHLRKERGECSSGIWRDCGGVSMWGEKCQRIVVMVSSWSFSGIDEFDCSGTIGVIIGCRRKRRRVIDTWIVSRSECFVNLGLEVYLLKHWSGHSSPCALRKPKCAHKGGVIEWNNNNVAHEFQSVTLLEACMVQRPMQFTEVVVSSQETLLRPKMWGRAYKMS